MVARKPDHQGDHEGNRNTIARGVPGCFGVPVVTKLMCFFHLHAGPWVRLIHPAFPAPSIVWGKDNRKTRANGVARMQALIRSSSFRGDA
jgi:hypothetical protein